ncbi:MAG: tetratricopeptide repeat protein [Cellvibrionaceae bacterium]|nr:tetratricopeptide repeat protein [Cellvibrionaceae bacterium]
MCLLLGLLSACGGLPLDAPAGHQLAAIENFLAAYPGNQKITEGRRFIELSDEMKRYTDFHVNHKGHVQTRLKQVFRASKSPALGITYDAGAHLNAAQVFEQGKANCLSFSALIIAMSRYSELPASFQEVELPPSWSLGNDDLLMRFRHVNVVVSIGRGRENIIDFRIDRFSHFYPRRKISDQQALALHFNNLAIEAMLAEDWSQVFSYLNAAKKADPQSATVWGNLGLALRRQDKLQLAEAAYLKALTLHPHDYGVMNNLAQVYSKTGRPELAARYQQRSSRHRLNNPYYHFANARRHYSVQNYSSALENLEQALRRKPEEGNFMQLKAYIYWHTDKRQAAVQWMRQAYRLEQNRRTQKAIRAQLDSWHSTLGLKASDIELKATPLDGAVLEEALNNEQE